ncbi:MAG: LysM peptidoglycan-binding domain-containing protein [Candidatus Symbiothrix sp.]|jgi:LysM repeat protein|nr:LysM peptidoglycan-binding domain-containing protein [Candidatus Symbiothrix sp.]
MNRQNNKAMLLRLALLIALVECLLATPCFGQQTDTLPRTEYAGVECYLYTVQKGEGLFRVSQKFGITQADILELNPSAADGLKIGQKIYIPVKDLSATNTKGDFITHNVAAGQTIYSITTKYGITKDELLQHNPFLDKGLKAGQTLKIPLKINVTESTVSTPIEPPVEPVATTTKNQPELEAETTIPTVKPNAKPTAKQSSDTAKQRILFIGDSMLETLGKRMRQYAAENGHDLLNVIWYSSSTKWWAQHIDTLSHFINDFRPTYIFICLGANELFVKDLQQRDKWTKQIIKRIGNIPFVWIGPPNWKEDTGINDVILKNTGKERFFLSKQLKFRRTKDGKHVATSSAADWLDAAIEYFNDNAPQTIVLRKPQNTENMRGKNVLLKPLKY